MGKLLVSEFVSLDGVYESPSWTTEFGFDPSMGTVMAQLMGPTSSDILLGRETHAMFAPAWSTRTAADDPGAPFMNDTTKHVVGSRPVEAEWAHSRAFGPYDPQRVRELRDRAAGNVWTTGSGTLVRALLADGLIDELHLFVYPVVLGAGERLFATAPDKAVPTVLTRTATDTYDNGVVRLAYSQHRS